MGGDQSSPILKALYTYDSTGTRTGVQQGNVTAYYMYNLQGDVVGLADAATGKIIAKYLYDAWGKCVSVENADGYTIGTANPFRYRGYYYDNETGFYYLNSRYYNPEVGRFLNADAFASTDISGVLSTNMFAYCENSRVNCSDPMGHAGCGLMSDWNPQEYFHKGNNPAAKPPELTIAVGFEGSAAFGPRVTGGAQLALETVSGDIYFLTYFGLGGGTPSASVGGTVTATSANAVKDLEGLGFVAGGSIPVPFFGGGSAGGEVVLGRGYAGATGSVSFGTPLPEMHAEATYTIAVNITDLLDMIGEYSNTKEFIISTYENLS